MDPLSTAYGALSDLNLWFKSNAGDPLNLADIPALIRTRYAYLVERWDFIKADLIAKLNSYSDPARLADEIDGFTAVVSQVRTTKDNRVQLNINELLANFFTVFDSLTLADVNPSPQERALARTEIARVNAFSKNSFVEMRTKMVAGRDAIADTIGGSDPTYNEIYEYTPLPQLLNKSIQNLVLSEQLEIGIDAATAILANDSILNTAASLDPFAFARANANNPDIDIRTFQSGRLTRLNYGESLQTVALRTMGDEARWVEISIANGLKPPYVDEVGVKLSLVANGEGNKVNVGMLDAFGNTNKDKFYVNQIVILQSSTQLAPDQRTIMSIREIPSSGELVLELSGSSDLNRYKTTDGASLRVFQKNTINSNFYILIPSNDPAPAVSSDEIPWFLKNKASDEKNAGVDLLIDDGGDLQFTPSGDFLLSYGVANALQAVKILMATEQGDLRFHSDYGITSHVGDKNIAINTTRRAIAESVSDQILNDPRFQRLDYLTVEYLHSTGAGYQVSLGVVLAGNSSSVVPITFSVNVA